MAINPSENDRSETTDRLRQEAARVRAAGALGRSDLIQRLFDFLVERSLKGETPRETDIAVEVFGRTDGFDVSQDASVRVYVYRLRRKLDEFYAGPGRDSSLRLSIPKGEYRLIVETQEPVPDTVSPESEHAESGRKNRRTVLAIAAGLIVVLALNGAAWAIFWPTIASGRLQALAAGPVWGPVIADGRPVIIAVGDYYIFGDTEKSMRVQRLVREFSINSREGLYQYLMSNPDKMGRYIDVGLRYLPISVAHAMNAVVPVLSGPEEGKRRVRVVLTSELTPEMLRANHVVYMGLLSGMGFLLDPVFAGSRYTIGETYDEIVDEESGQHYVSRINPFDTVGAPDRDYGYFATFAGPSGNRIVIISGTRDVAVQQVAAEVTDPDSLAELKTRADGENAFEALYAVEGIRQVSMDDLLVNVSRLDTTQIWRGAPVQEFPSE